MIIFQLMSIQFMDETNIINWKEQTITLRHNIKLLHITINHYPNNTYTSKEKSNICYKWSLFIEYWNKHILEYNKAFTIEFNKFTLGVDYILAPLYIMNNTSIIGIYILNKTILYSLVKNIVPIIKISYSFLCSVEPYLDNTNTNTNTNKYNFIHSIINSHNSHSNNNYLINKEFNLDTSLDTSLDTALDTSVYKLKNIPLKYILQNSINYLPKLKIISIKRTSQNLLNP